MTKTLNRLLIGAIIAGLTGCDIAAADTTTPMERVTSVPRGQLKSPYPDFAGVAEQGHKLFQAYDCGGCHGGGGGGGMAAPRTKRSSDRRLATMTPCSRLIAPRHRQVWSRGNAFQKQGFVRKGSENVVGPMPPYGEIIATEDDIWKIIAWIRAKNCERDAARC